MARKKRVKDLETLQARFVTHHGVRNTSLENFHCGHTPRSKTGDYSDVKVVTPYGEIPWTEVSRISNAELRHLMLDIEKHIKKTLRVFELAKANYGTLKEFQNRLTDDLFTVGVSWDEDHEEIKRRLEQLKPLNFED